MTTSHLWHHRHGHRRRRRSAGTWAWTRAGNIVFLCERINRIVEALGVFPGPTEAELIVGSIVNLLRVSGCERLIDGGIASSQERRSRGTGKTQGIRIERDSGRDHVQYAEFVMSDFAAQSVSGEILAGTRDGEAIRCRASKRMRRTRLILSHLLPAQSRRTK